MSHHLHLKSGSNSDISASLSVPAPVELPPSVQPCNLKGQLYIPPFDHSIHNVQGIDVWANKGPRSWNEQKASTLPRSESHEVSFLSQFE